MFVLYLLTFGPSQHKAETLAVFFLQKHCLLLDYIVTSRKEMEERHIETITNNITETEGHVLHSTSAFISGDDGWKVKF